MNEILAEQVNRAERLTTKAFFLLIVQMVLRLAVVQIVVTLVNVFLKAPVLNLLFYAYAVAEVLLFLRQILASDRYVLRADRLLLERRMGDMVLFSLNVPTDQIAAIREFAAGEKLSVSYARVKEFRRQAKVPLRVRLGRGLAMISSRLGARCAGSEAGKPCGLVLAYHDGMKIKACTFEPDAGMLGALGRILGDRMGTDDRLARPHLRTFKARVQARAFPELYPHVVPLVTEADEEWARTYTEQLKQEKARKKAEKEAKLSKLQSGKKRRKKQPKKTGKGPAGTKKPAAVHAVPETEEPAYRSMEIPAHPVSMENKEVPEKPKNGRRRRSGNTGGGKRA